MSKNDKKAVGIFILTAGLIILLGQWGVFAFLGRVFWPLLILLPGVGLHLAFASRALPAWALIPGGTLTVYGLVFSLCNTWGFGLIEVLWPAFLLGPGLGLYEYALLGPVRPKGIYYASLGLIVLSLVLFIFSLLGPFFLYAFSVLLILSGAWLVFWPEIQPAGRRGKRRM
ncbi:intracellular growth attenuator family protein [Saccharibacillus brassicae]|uniref:Intracellular growth attenuator family protein n=1 Tax=Saccharibacillus brassicae TaxID=2583377 RepID=A0A4Y6UQJ3_SACBS|nr:intracellular growth attenuator family protein [Saccharibacillus brassicae]QDH19903.1 intracellular growth attenuator family protein [Saccharibacillus brassicae]